MATKKDVRLNIRIDEVTKRRFLELCDDKSINGSDLVRKFIERWISENGGDKNV